MEVFTSTKEIAELCNEIISKAELREEQMKEEVAELRKEIEELKKENEELKMIIEKMKVAAADPFTVSVTYIFVVEYIASKTPTKAEPLIAMFEAFLPQSMHKQLHKDIEKAHDERIADRIKDKKAYSGMSPRITAEAGSNITIVQGTNIENVNDYNL